MDKNRGVVQKARQSVDRPAPARAASQQKSPLRGRSE